MRERIRTKPQGYTRDERKLENKKWRDAVRKLRNKHNKSIKNLNDIQILNDRKH